MPEAADWQAIVKAGWDSIKAKVSAELPKAVVGKPLSDHTYNEGLGVCVLLNGPNTGAAVWNDDGPGTVALTSLQVGDFTSVSGQDAKFGNLEVELPLSFALLAANGRYAYVQPCAQYSLGKKGAPARLNGAGKISARSERGSLTYQLKVVDPDKALRLELIGAKVDGQRSINLEADGQPSNALLRILLGSFNEGSQRLIISSALDSFFSHGEFGRDMVNELNRIIGATHAQRAQG